MQSAKLNIKKVVSEYKRAFPDEYRTVVDAVKMHREMIKDGYLDEDSLDLSGGDDQRRALYEMPVTLFQNLAANLTEDQMLWLKSGGRNKKEGGRWFAKTFPEFSLVDPNKI